MGVVGLLAALLAPSGVGATPLGAEAADRLRIQEHLSRVEERLRQAPVDELDASARVRRARLLDELHRYWQAGVFPRNSRHPNERRPYFIDDAGRACAVGALIQRSGYEALAKRIDDAFHNDYVPDMQDTELLAWANAHGFSVAELALIQPSYCACGTGFDVGGGQGGQGGAADDDPAAYRPVCGSNGLTYWNECIAEVCGGVEVMAAGECAHEPPCELCGSGERYVAVSECSPGGAPEGLCDLDSQLEVVPVSDQVAARWLEMQQRDCQDPDYDLGVDDQSRGWQPAQPPTSTSPAWDCTNPSGGAGGESPSGGAAGESPSGGAGGGQAGNTPQGGLGSSDAGTPGASGAPRSNDPEPSGCSCTSASGRGGSGAPLALLALTLLRRRARRGYGKR